MQIHRHHKRLSLRLENLIVKLKENNPAFAIKAIQKIMSQKYDRQISIKGIHNILKRYGLADHNLAPLRGPKTAESEKCMRSAHVLQTQGKFRKTANILNALPALADFSILEKIPCQYLSLRRQVEQLEVIWNNLTLEQRFKRAHKFRTRCERKRFFYTGIFALTLEMNALNFLGYPAKIFTIYKKYHKYLPGITPVLRNMFLMECFISSRYLRRKYPKETFKNFSYIITNFVNGLKDKDRRIEWYDALSAYFQQIGDTEKSANWLNKLLQEVPRELRSEYLPSYLWLLAAKGAYKEILDFNESFEGISAPFPLRALLAQSYATLGIGRAKEALEMALNGFYRAEKAHLHPAMQGFTFFIACCYGALKEFENMKKYLELFSFFSTDMERNRILCSLLIGKTQPSHRHFTDAYIHLTNQYLFACKTLRRKDYIAACNFAKRKGLTGLLHRIILFRPQAVTRVLKKRKKVFLPDEFLELPVFKENRPELRLFLLKKRESILYGNREMHISPRSKDFHLLTYLFLNRKKYLDREDLISWFYGKADKPMRGLTKALSRIRGALGLTKETLVSRKDGVCFNVETRIDLEEFENKYKMAKILEKVGETDRALQEYQQCYTMYKKSPFEKMGYYYNFAEERRTIARNMYEELCDHLLTHAREKGETKIADHIKMKSKRENLDHLLS